jgi:hypothetical protein
MFFLRPVEPSLLGLTACTQNVPQASNGFLICGPLLWPANQSGESWQAIYCLAYKQLVLALAPSPFQRAIEPSIN